MSFVNRLVTIALLATMSYDTIYETSDDMEHRVWYLPEIKKAKLSDLKTENGPAFQANFFFHTLPQIGMLERELTAKFMMIGFDLAHGEIVEMIGDNTRSFYSNTLKKMMISKTGLLELVNAMMRIMNKTVSLESGLSADQPAVKHVVIKWSNYADNIRLTECDLDMHEINNVRILTISNTFKGHEMEVDLMLPPTLPLGCKINVAGRFDVHVYTKPGVSLNPIGTIFQETDDENMPGEEQYVSRGNLLHFLGAEVYGCD